MRAPIDPPAQLRALVRAFLARFFESEITSGADDVKGSFFWLLAALAIPGLFIPWIMVFDWQLVAMLQGADGLREASRAEKVFYLGFAMIASGLLTAIVWNSVLPDRRDTLILGALPVGPRTIVAAKIAALAGYVAIVAVSMHGIGAVFFGTILSTDSPFFFLIRGVVAHFVASCAATACVALSVAAAQGLTLALAGPRLFRRAAVLLQALLVGVIALGLALLPSITSATVHTVRGFGRNVEPWILSTPPVWFLGLYEWILGTSDPLIVHLARLSALAIALPAATIAIAYPLAYRRLMVSMVDAAETPGRSALARAANVVVVSVAGRHGEARAAADFFTATIARVERHRFVLAIVLGVAFVWGVPGWRTFHAGTGPQPGLLSLPLVAMMFLLVGLRIAASLPADIRASWLFEVHGPSRRRVRQALERIMFLVGVVPVLAVSTAVYWSLWGRGVALMHAGISIALGVVLIELLIWRCEGMPCGQRWNPARLDLGRRWPLHAALFLAVAAGVPRLELLLLRSPSTAMAFLAVLSATAVLVRHASAKHTIVPSYDDVDPVAGVLRLN